MSGADTTPAAGIQPAELEERRERLLEVVRAAGVPETGGPFNLCVRHGDMVYVSGLPPFEEDYCAALRAARARGSLRAGRSVGNASGYPARIPGLE